MKNPSFICKLFTSSLGFSESTTASMALWRVDVAQWKWVGSHFRSCICNNDQVNWHTDR